MTDSPATAALDDLLALLRAPRRMANLDARRWDALLVVARAAGLLARLAEEAARLDLLDALPEPVRPHFRAASILAERHRRLVAWELECLDRALAPLEAPVVLLKGAAYLAADLPIARGRLYGDIDLLLPVERLPDAERTLLASGWEAAELAPRDARYFRAWLHELPPLVHRRRRVVVDLHHSILPRTDRLRLDPSLLIASATPVPGARRLRVLAPADMALHGAAHLFRNGDFAHAVRDLCDLDGMLRHFAGDEAFWQTLLDRAARLDLRLPCYCGLRYARLLYATPIPASVLAAIAPWRPRLPSVALLDRLVRRAITPRHLDRPDPRRRRAAALLAHWPIPRPRALLAPLFWLKRLPEFGQTRKR